MKPSIGRIVHYVSRGSADGVYQPECRAAMITALSPNYGSSRVALCVINPTGIFFHEDVLYLDPSRDAYDYERPGTWHWPERVDED